MSAPPQLQERPENIGSNNPLVVQELRLLYFGCQNGMVGHFLWSGEWRSARLHSFFNPPAFGSALDGAFCPPNISHEGEYKSSYVPPWTIVSWWDCSVDKRPGSHSTFLVDRLIPAEELLRLARIKFPSVFARQRFAIRCAQINLVNA